MDIAGKSAIVTGGAIRIGRAIALGLASHGVNICLHYNRSADAAKETADEIIGCGGQAVIVQADLSMGVDPAAAVLAATVETYGQADILINSAAIFESGRLSETSTDIWDRHLDINLKAPFFLAQAFQKFQISPAENGPRHIVNIVDWRAQRPDPRYLAYSISKAGLVAMTKGLATDLAPDIRVNAVALGAILPPPAADEAYLDRVAKDVPLARTGTTDDVVDAVLYLVRSDFITGHVLSITGGQELS